MAERGRTGGQSAGWNKSQCSPLQSPSSAHTYHTWVLGLQGYKLTKRCHMGRLGRRGRRWGVKDVVVTGDEVGVGMVGHGELLHGARLDQLLREAEKLGQCLPRRPGRPGSPAQLKVPMDAQARGFNSSAHPCSRAPGRMPHHTTTAAPLPLYAAGTLLQTVPQLQTVLNLCGSTHRHCSGKGQGQHTAWHPAQFLRVLVSTSAEMESIRRGLYLGRRKHSLTGGGRQQRG